MVGTLEDFDGPLTKFDKGAAKLLTAKAPSASRWRSQGKGAWIVSITSTAHQVLAPRQHGLRCRRAGRWCRARYDVCDGKDEDWLHELSISVFPEDGCLHVYGVGDGGVAAFTDHGIECLKQIVANESAAGNAPPHVKSAK
jgi:hypothetical protein